MTDFDKKNVVDNQAQKVDVNENFNNEYKSSNNSVLKKVADKLFEN